MARALASASYWPAESLLRASTSRNRPCAWWAGAGRGWQRRGLDLARLASSAVRCAAWAGSVSTAAVRSGRGSRSAGRSPRAPPSRCCAPGPSAWRSRAPPPRPARCTPGRPGATTATRARSVRPREHDEHRQHRRQRGHRAAGDACQHSHHKDAAGDGGGVQYAAQASAPQAALSTAFSSSLLRNSGVRAWACDPGKPAAQRLPRAELEQDAAATTRAGSPPHCCRWRTPRPAARRAGSWAVPKPPTSPKLQAQLSTSMRSLGRRWRRVIRRRDPAPCGETGF